jgi:hypothetical protein
VTTLQGDLELTSSAVDKKRYFFEAKSLSSLGVAISGEYYET